MTVLRKNGPKEEAAQFVDGFCVYLVQKGIKVPEDIKINSDDDDEDSDDSSSEEADTGLVPFISKEPDIIFE